MKEQSSSQTPLTGAQPARPLSRRLREDTRAEHEAAENTRFIQDLFHGRLDRSAYALYLAALAEVYATLESALRDATEPDSAAADPRLERHPALLDDLQTFAETRDPAVVLATNGNPALRQAVADYRHAITQAADSRSGRLIAHAYVRYLGDLSGGQILGRKIAGHFDLPQSGEGLRFYQFPQIPDPTTFKSAYRERLDTLPLTDPQTQAVTTEAQRIFQLNMALFEAIPSSCRNP